jgi:predicted nucleotidyltransferase
VGVWNYKPSNADLLCQEERCNEFLMSLTPFEVIFQSLNKQQVKYIVVGGLAVVLHGHLRTTADIDIVLALDKKNALCAVKALKELGYQPRPPVLFEDFADSEKRKVWMKEKGLTVFSTYSANFPGIEIDLFVKEPFVFAEVFARAKQIKLEETVVTVASLDDLIAMKKKVGRPIDLADVDVLKLIQANSKDKDNQ